MDGFLPVSLNPYVNELVHSSLRLSCAAPGLQVGYSGRFEQPDTVAQPPKSFAASLAPHDISVPLNIGSEDPDVVFPLTVQASETPKPPSAI